MNISKDVRQKFLQLVPTQSNPHINGTVLKIGRYLVGRSESCEIYIPNSIVSAIHAVLEVTPNGMKVYDMNSKNSVYVNGNKVIASQLKLGDTIAFGNVEFSLKEYVDESELPPVLETLSPLKGKANPITDIPDLPAASPKIESHSDNDASTKEDTPYIVYPLSLDPKSDFSEYIFEDSKELYPIFKYEHNKQAVEVIILFNDKVFSVDYLPEKNGTYQIAGATKEDSEIEFPYLAKNEKVPFIEMSHGNCNVHRLNNYELTHLSDNNLSLKDESSINLQDNDIVKLQNEHLEIYVRKVSKPPKVKSPPFFRRDNSLKKYIALMLLFIILPVVGLNLYEVDEELKKEKDPERIATILYKQKLLVNKNKAVEKTEKKNVKKQKVVKKKTPSKPKKVTKNKAAPVKSKSSKKPTPNPGKKTAKTQQKVKKVNKPAPKRKSTKVAATKSAARKSSKTQTRRANVASKSVGRTDVFKSFDFKSSVNTLVAKGGSLKGARTSSTTASNINSASVGGGVATNVKKANVGTDVGSLTGAAVGKLGQSKGVEGLSTKTGVYTAGIPSETVVLGSMDPDVIRRILREHIPQFRYCYQKQLDRSTKNLSGTIRLVFTIGASGYVSRAGVDGRTALPSSVKGCVINVLRGIQFPRPLGGGTVDVKQPFNFFPKNV